jgi:indole-3-glycerol phosphate synthase
MTILKDIIQYKKSEVQRARKKRPFAKLEKSPLFTRKTLSLRESLLDTYKTGIIAEFKRKSPSKGVINSVSTVEEVTTGYFRSGASGLSILTDQRFFGGSNADLKRARQLNPIPILRKDFIIDEYQITEAKAIGADAILIIAASTDKKRAGELSAYARSLDLEVLLEIHEEAELEYINDDINIVGVNNRDLRTFNVDIERSVSLACLIPEEFLKISESGINSPLVLKKLRNCGYKGFLIGENFMRMPEPAKAFSDFVELITAAI